MSENIFVKDYAKGISRILNNYIPSIFEENALTCFDADYTNGICSWCLTFSVSGEAFSVKTNNGLFFESYNGILQSFKKNEELTPLVLLETRERLLKERENEKYVKEMVLDDFHIVRGETLAKALVLIELIVSTVTFRKSSDGENEKKKEVYFYSSEEIKQRIRLESFQFRFESLVNHTFRGAEFLPLYLQEEMDDIPLRIRTIKCPCYLPLEAKNPLHYESEKRKVVYHSEKCAKSLRQPHFSHLGKLDMLESPESEDIGLTLFMTRGAIYDSVNLCIKGTSEEELSEKPELALSFSSSCVPFLNYSDGPRVTMGGKNLKQGIRALGAEKPKIRTSEDELLDFGVNAFVGYMMYEGYNFEDGIVVSESFAEKMNSIRHRTVKNSILFDIFSFDNRYEERDEFSDYCYIYSDFEEAKKASSKQKRDLNKYRRCYRYKYRGNCYDKEILLEEFVERRLCLKPGKKGAGNKAEYADWEVLEDSRNVLMRYKGLYSAKVESAVLNIRAIDYREIPIKVYDSAENSEDVYHLFKKKSMIEKTEFLFHMIEEKPFAVGDKMTGRHGNKGTVSKILPDEVMPEVVINQTTGEKKRLDCLLSPMGVVSRMNIGQLLEIHASMVFDEKVVKPFSFSVEDVELLKRDLVKRGADEWGYFRLTDNRRIAAGYQYMVRLDHCVRDKLHVVKKAAVSVLNGQPLKGRRRNGGQRIGEMEFWTLFSHRAFNVIEDFARTNVDRSSKSFREIYDTFKAGHSEILNRLFNESFKTYKYKELKKAKGEKSYFNSQFEISQDDMKTNIFVESLPQPEKPTAEEKKKAREEKAAKLDDMSPIERAAYKREKEKKTMINDFFRGYFGKTVNLLNGKDGYLRKHMLGRRIHYSGRAAISPSPKLGINVTHLPLDAGIEWFEDVVLKEFSYKQIGQAKQNENQALRTKMADFLSKYCQKRNYFVLLNRQPSLHRHSIQAFHLTFWDQYSIALPTIVCDAYGADFDGDTMAFYFPVFQFQTDDRDELSGMLPTSNPYRLGDRKPAWSSAQDFAFGQYVLDGSGKSGVEKEFFTITQSENSADALQSYKKRLFEASKKELSLSFFDAVTPMEAKKSGPFLKVFKDSGARGKDQQFKQLTDTIDILNGERNFGDGLTLEEYLCYQDNEEKNIATRSRKNLMEKKLSVANAGYFTRKMVSFLYPCVIKSEDCHTKEGFVLTRESFDKLNQIAGSKEKEVFDLKRFVLGRYIKEESGEWSSEPVDEGRYEKLKNSDWQQIEIRSPLKCKDGLCKRCYGADIAKSKLNSAALPKINDFVGLSAGHVIGEFGTQLSMKTFQTGDNFSPEKLSGLFFSRYRYDENSNRDEKTPLLSYMAYLQNIAAQKAGSDSLFKSIGVYSIHMEILYRYMEICKVKKESEMKNLFTIEHLGDMGILSALSFESARSLLLGRFNKKKKLTSGIFESIEFDEKNEFNGNYVEKSPSVTYMFATPVLKKVFDDE